MSRRNDDCDEWCDPENPRTIKYEDVVEAAARIKPNVIKTLCIPSHYQHIFGMHLYFKCEFMQRTGSFKDRGILNTLQLLPSDNKKLGVITASIGNGASALSFFALKLGIPVVVVMPTSAPIFKLQKIHVYGTKVIIQGNNLVEAKRYARAIARDKGLTYIDGRDRPSILAGAGTIALEILEQLPLVDAVIVPVGTGGLLASVATVIKRNKPSCLIYGVQTESNPVFFKSLEIGEPVGIHIEPSIADAIAVPYVGVNSFSNAHTLVDKMLLVNEDWIARAILHFVEQEKFVVEGAGACPLAAILGNLVPELKLKTVVCILSGGNIDNALLTRSLERGRASEGRLLRFKVGIKDNSKANAQLLKLIKDTGANVVSQLSDRVWAEGDVYNVELKILCETKGLEHSLELKRIIEKAYQDTTFETEPFNDRRTCPCFVKK